MSKRIQITLLLDKDIFIEFIGLHHDSCKKIVKDFESIGYRVIYGGDMYV
jgi:hypothetical protein